MATSGAKFKIGTSPSSDRGYDGAASQTLSFQLEASPALDVRSCTYELLLLTKNGPALTLSSGGVATPPTATVTCALPSGADVYAFAVRCQTNGGEAIILADGTKDYSVNTFERIVVVRSTLTGLRKIIVGETLEYDPAFGWTEAINEMIDVIETLSAGSITFGGTPPAIAASGGAGIAGSASRSDHTHAHGNQAGGSTHAAAVAGSSAGFITGTDQQKLDDATSAATASKLVLRDGSGNASFVVALAKQFRATPFAVTFGASITLSTANGALQTLTLTGDTTFNAPTVTAGDRLTLVVTQDATGGRAITWDANFWFPSASAAADMTLTSAPAAIDVFEFVSISGKLYCLNAKKDISAP